MWARFVLFVLVLTVAAVSLGQDSRNRKKGENGDRIEFDFSFDYDPAELRENISNKLRFKRIWGPFGIAGYHIFPAAEDVRKKSRFAGEMGIVGPHFVSARGVGSAWCGFTRYRMAFRCCSLTSL